MGQTAPGPQPGRSRRRDRDGHPRLTDRRCSGSLYAAKNLTVARWKLIAFYQHAADADIPELTRLAKTVSAWENEILNYHVTGISNGPTEAQNLIAEKLRRVGHGMRNFENYRLRLLLHSSVAWNTPSTARIRGRHPRLIA